MEDIKLFFSSNNISYKILNRGRCFYTFNVNDINCELYYTCVKHDIFILRFYLESSKVNPLFLNSIITKIKGITLNDNYIFEHMFENIKTCKRLILHLKKI